MFRPLKPGHTDAADVGLDERLIDADLDFAAALGHRADGLWDQRARVRLLRLRHGILEVQREAIAATGPGRVDKARIVDRHRQTRAVDVISHGAQTYPQTRHRPHGRGARIRHGRRSESRFPTLKRRWAQFDAVHARAATDNFGDVRHAATGLERRLDAHVTRPNTAQPLQACDLSIGHRELLRDSTRG